MESVSDIAVVESVLEEVGNHSVAAGRNIAVQDKECLEDDSRCWEEDSVGCMVEPIQYKYDLSPNGLI